MHVARRAPSTRELLLCHLRETGPFNQLSGYVFNRGTSNMRLYLLASLCSPRGKGKPEKTHTHTHTQTQTNTPCHDAWEGSGSLSGCSLLGRDRFERRAASDARLAERGASVHDVGLPGAIGADDAGELVERASPPANGCTES